MKKTYDYICLIFQTNKYERHLFNELIKLEYFKIILIFRDEFGFLKVKSRINELVSKQTVSLVIE